MLTEESQFSFSSVRAEITIECFCHLLLIVYRTLTQKLVVKQYAVTLLLFSKWTDTLPVFTYFTVPGDGGSQYEAKLDKPSVVHWLCTKKTDDWYPLWLNLELLAPYAVDCFVDNMK